MKYDPERHHRQSIRLKGYDYSQQGAYFVTICTYKRCEVFGEIRGGEMYLSSQGEIAQAMWKTLPKRFPGIELDSFVIMPNHIHGIVVRSQYVTPKPANQTVPPFKYSYKSFRTTSHRFQTLNEMMRTFKAVTSYHVRKKENAAFAWQRGYYEYIIRNEKELGFIRSYIVNNPAKWQEDKLHPLRGNETLL